MNLSQEAFANKYGLDHTGIERDKINPTLDVINVLTKDLYVDLKTKNPTK